jgi:hypothetical protein
MNRSYNEKSAENPDSVDEWFTYKDDLADTRLEDLKRVEFFLDCCLRGENTLHNIFKQVSALDLIDLKEIWEVVIELVISGCGFHEFDKNKQRALVRAVTSDISSIIKKTEYNLKIDVGWPNYDLQILQLSERPATPNLPSCSVTLVLVADHCNHAEKLISALKELVFPFDEGPVHDWPSLVARIQEELLGLDGSDWDRSEVPFKVLVEVAPIARKVHNDFLTFSSNEFPFRPFRRKVERLLFVGGRDPHKNDFSKWARGLQHLPAESLHERETSKMHSFTILASSYSPTDYR